MSFAATQLAWAGFILDVLESGGVTDLVVSPGSRSTPLVMASLSRKNFSIKCIRDERSAGFFALGQAKVTHKPTALICTSGTALAHYFPAVIEASQTNHPLIIISADRPPSLQGNAANQSIDQSKFFGSYVRKYYELGIAEGKEEAFAGLARKVGQALSDSQYPVPGPVHLNAQFRKPFEDNNLSEKSIPQINATIPKVIIPEPTSPGDISGIVELCRSHPRGLLVCGSLGIPQNESEIESILVLSRKLGYPLLADVTSQVRYRNTNLTIPNCLTFDTFLRNEQFTSTHAPGLIIQLGEPPLSSGYEDFLNKLADCSRVVVSPHRWPDPNNNATHHIRSDITQFANMLSSMVDKNIYDRDWLADFHRVEWETRQQILDELRCKGDDLKSGDLAADLAELLPNNSLLCLGNSMPVRDFGKYALKASSDIIVLTQRGASGIDGLISGACGAAQKWPGPTTLFLGDVSFLHDIGSLLTVREATRPLVIVVANNDGGRIFEKLPVSQLPDFSQQLQKYWVMSHGLTFAKAAEAFGIEYGAVESRAELTSKLKRAYLSGQSYIIEAKIAQSK